MKANPSATPALESIQLIHDNFGSTACVYFVLPNVVLTLANARAVADGIFYHPDKRILKARQKEIAEVLGFLKQQKSFSTDSYIHKNPRGQSYAGYEFINPEGLRQTLPRYSFLSPADQKLVFQGNQSFEILTDIMQKILGQNKELTKHISSINDITWGVLLGYPEKAIFSAVEFFQQEPEQFGSRPSDADIRGADYYPCPKPVYSYARELVVYKTIVQHERLWSSILEDFYTSDLHKQLAKDKAFTERITAITSY